MRTESIVKHLWKKVPYKWVLKLRQAQCWLQGHKPEPVYHDVGTDKQHYEQCRNCLKRELISRSFYLDLRYGTGHRCGH
jgi:hypothetical protein